MTSKRRSLLTLLCVPAAGLALAACGAGGSNGESGDRISMVPAHARRTAAGNRAAARRDARRLLGRLKLPAGSRRSPREPSSDGGALAGPADTPDTPNLVKRHRWWVVPGRPQAVLAYFDAHRPAGSRQSETASAWKQGAIVSRSQTLSFASRSGVLETRALLVEVTQLPDGSTGLRADAQVVWITPRPATERIPTGLRRLDVWVIQPTRPARLAQVQGFSVRSKQRIARVSALLNALPLFPPGTYSCPSGREVLIRLVFRRAPGGTPLAIATVDSGGCRTVQMVVREKRQPDLRGIGVKRLEAALGTALHH